jgi:hypothetical protein
MSQEQKAGIEELIQSLQAEIASRSRHDEKTVPSYLCINNLKSKLSRLEHINEVLNIEKYNLVFIGTIGQGKTTAICHLFNLIGDFEGNKTINGKSRSVVETRELLATGSGRTTICEVIIKSAPTTHVEIDPYTAEEMTELILNFCDSLLQEENISGEQKVPIPREVETAVRNIIGLKRVVRQIEGKETTIDQAKELLEKSNLETLKKTALENANLSQRNTTRIEYTPQLTELNNEVGVGNVHHEKAWIRNTFRQLNNGSMSNFAIPSRISIFVSPSVLGNSKLNEFESIIDTKGIDENPIRRDLQEYIERDDTICLFATSFKDAPETNIRELMRFNLFSKSREFHHRFITFVVTHKGEAEKVNDSEGRRETGIVIRRDDIQSVFKSLNLDFFVDNIVFYDALQFYKSAITQIDTDLYTVEDAQEDSNRCISEICSAINHRKRILIEDVNKIEQSFQSIQSGKTLSNDEIVVINDAVSKIKNLRDLGGKIPSFIYDDAANGFVNYYHTQYKAWNTKHAIHRNYGVYLTRNIDVFYDGKVFAEGRNENEMLRRFTKEVKEELEDILKSLVKANYILEDFIPELIIQFHSYYDDFIDQVGEDIEQFLLSEKIPPRHDSSEFWAALIDQKGKPRSKGETYTSNVRQIWQQQLESSPSFGQCLKKSAEKHWTELVNQVLAFFGE